MGSVGWAESQLYNGNFPKYNPDELIGRKGFKIYRQMMLDEQVKAVVKFKRDAITSRDFYFTLNDERLTEDEADHRLATYDAMIDNVCGSFNDGLNFIMSAMYQGFSLTEKLFEVFEYRDIPYVGLYKLKPKPYDSFKFKTDQYGDIEKIIQELDAQEQEIDLAKFVYFIHNPEFDEHYGQSELREAYRSWYSKDVVIRLYNQFLERFAGGFVVARPGDGQTLTQGTREYNAVLAAIQNIRQQTSILFPNQMELEVHQPASTDQFEKAIVMHDLQIAKALLVPNLLGVTHQGDTGSYSQASTQLEAFLWTLDADAARLEDTLNEQIFAPLSVVNFADGIGPKLKFKPVSEQKKFELIKTWKGLVEAKAVRPTDADEDQLREMLDMPLRPAPEVIDDQSAVVEPSSALNGAQVTAMKDIILSVSSGELPRQNAIEIILKAFPVSRKEAEALVVSDEGVKPAQRPAPENDISEPEGIEIDDEEIVVDDETLMGAPSGQLVSNAAFTAALKRVSFTVIDRKTNDLEVEATATIEGDVAAMIAGLIEVVKEEGYGTAEGDLEAMHKLDFPKKSKTRTRKSIDKSLQVAWNLGQRHAADEISQAQQQTFRADMERLEQQAAAFLANSGFRMLGNLTSDMLKIIQSVLVNGVKYSWMQTQIIENIYDALTSAGFIVQETNATATGRTVVEIQEKLQKAVTTPARIATAVRTNTFEALNEARYAEYTDPELGGFVEALEYSAILDDRTTDICTHLDGRVYPADSSEWEGYRPPNHYNCRSILIPVTIVDTEVVGKDAPQGERYSKPPRIEPQQGFGGKPA